MVNGCGLIDWGRNSQVTHAVASDPTGPYTKVDVALPVWAHNPQISYLPNNNPPLFALWHIGDGNGGDPDNCTGDLTYHEPRFEAQGSVLHLANSPSGPWIPVLDPLPSCNNPTQWQHSNGTWFLVCDSTSMYRAPNITGPYTFVLKIPTGNTPGIFEDGFLWIDARGNWHQFFHTYTMSCADPTCAPTAISGHSFSMDGLNWRSSSVQPYFNVVNVTDGTQVVMSTRERPKLLFNDAGEPTHLFNGMCPTAACAPQPAIECKNLFWDHTIVVPLSYE